MMDLLAPLFERFTLSARMFYSGAFCGISPNLDEQAGYLHVLKKGRLTITHPNARPIVVDTPSIIFLPRPHQHRLHASEEEGTELVCATVEFGTGMLNPLPGAIRHPPRRPPRPRADAPAALLGVHLQPARPPDRPRSPLRVCPRSSL